MTQGTQTRTFMYDPLGRLTSASNPESGLTSYTYDDNGNLLTKTDALGKVTCFGDLTGTTCDSSEFKGYDALNRVKKKTYSDTTPAVTYGYETCTFGRGRLCSVGNGVSTTNVSVM